MDDDLGAALAYDARVGRNIAQLRQARGMTQAQLSQALDHFGVTLSQPVVVKVEQGRRSVRLHEAQAIAAVLRVGLDELVAHEPPDRAARALELVEDARFRAEMIRNSIEAWVHATTELTMIYTASDPTGPNGLPARVCNDIAEVLNEDLGLEMLEAHPPEAAPF